MEKDANAEDYLPRSLYVPQEDPRQNMREIVDSIFSDKFMIFLSIILIPIILIPFLVDVSPAVFAFLDMCDMAIVLLFVAEYVLKLYFASDRWAHFKSPWHLVDLVIVTLLFVQYIPIVELSATGSYSLLLRLLRLPRAFAVGSRAVAGRRVASRPIAETIKLPDTIIRQVDLNLKTTQNGLTWSELEEHLSDYSRQEWIDIDNISDEGFATLSKILKIPELHFKSKIVDEIYPHIDYVQCASFIFIQSGKIQYPENANNYLTISKSGIIVVCNGTKIITVSRHSVDLFNKVLNSIKSDQKDEIFVVPTLYSILEQTLNDYKSLLSEIELEIIKIGKTPKSKLPRDFLERIYQLDKEVTRLVSNLVHYKDLLGTIISKRVPLEGFDESSEEAFNVLQQGATYLNEIADDLTDNLQSIIDLYINQTSFETNRILKILAVITSISVIPSAIGGILGMNLLDVNYGAYLWQVAFIIGLAMTFTAYIFIKLGWLKT
jgi:Mg2+ and Co2+ transporter CorA